MLCAVWYTDRLPNNLNLEGRSILQNMEQPCRQSLMGPLVATDILAKVPDIKTFRTATRCIKLWATRNGVYSNVYGFPGGVAWALMVARVCQLYPTASASHIVSKFFHTMANWNWGWENPIVLDKLRKSPLSWNPKVKKELSWSSSICQTRHLFAFHTSAILGTEIIECLWLRRRNHTCALLTMWRDRLLTL